MSLAKIIGPIVAVIVLFVVFIVWVETRPAVVHVDDEKDHRAVVVYSDPKGSVKRMVDEEYGIVCYVYSGHYKSGISCIPSY